MRKILRVWLYISMTFPGQYIYKETSRGWATRVMQGHAIDINKFYVNLLANDYAQAIITWLFRQYAST